MGLQRVNGHTPYRQAHSVSYRSDSRMHISRDCPRSVHSHYWRSRFWTQTYQDFHPGFSGILALKEMAFFLQMCFVQQIEEIKIQKNVIKIEFTKRVFNYYFYHYAPSEPTQMPPCTYTAQLQTSKWPGYATGELSCNTDFPVFCTSDPSNRHETPF